MIPTRSLRCVCCWVAVLGGSFITNTGAAIAQGVSGAAVSDSKVGYIDNAIPGDLIRFRYDTSYQNRRPNRAEFFWAQNGPLGPGVPLPERSVDYQDLTVYMEGCVSPHLSLFCELPTRYLDPEVNDNTGGFADMNAGFKYAFVHSDCRTISFQLRTYAPTGDAGRGLGNRHVSLEPEILAYERVGEKLAVEAELRYWIPVNGTDFAGDIIRYGIGAQYEVGRLCNIVVTPVVELVGWTVLDGMESFVFPSGEVATVSAAGNTIINAKLGTRLTFCDHADFYIGYGRPLTGDRWYENTLRLEMRVLF